MAHATNGHNYLWIMDLSEVDGWNEEDRPFPHEGWLAHYRVHHHTDGSELAVRNSYGYSDDCILIIDGDVSPDPVSAFLSLESRFRHHPTLRALYNVLSESEEGGWWGYCDLGPDPLKSINDQDAFLTAKYPNDPRPPALPAK